MFNRKKGDESAPETAEADSKPAAHAADTSLGVPPFRPETKETPMARPPFPAAGPNPPIPTSPTPPRVPATPVLRQATPVREGVSEKRTLVVGRGISLQGVVQDAERLVVEGQVESTAIRAAELSVSHGGTFKGEVEVDEAEIAGTLDGTVIARQALIVRATGRVVGVARCRRLQVEDGGHITGRIEMLGEAAPPANAPAPAPAHVQAERPTMLERIPTPG